MDIQQIRFEAIRESMRLISAPWEADQAFKLADRIISFVEGTTPTVAPPSPVSEDEITPVEMTRLMMIAERPSLLFPYLSISSFNGTTPLEPYPHQLWIADALVSPKKTEVVVNAARQMGTTTTLAAIALWRALFHPATTTIYATPKMNSASSVQERVLEMIANLPAWFGARPKRVVKGQFIEFENGSFIRFGGEFRGVAFSYALIDNAGFFSYKVFEEAYAFMKMMCTNNNGKIIVASTSGEVNSPFHRLTQPKDDRIVLTLPWYVSPAFNENKIKDCAVSLGREEFEKSFCCKFDEVSK